MFVVRASRVDYTPVPLEKDRFAQLPIRIGRHPLNDVCLNHGMVSAFHARIEDIDGKIYLRDLSSKNGVFVFAANPVTPVRISPDVPIDLAQVGNTFFVGSVFRIVIEQVASDTPLRASHANGQVLGNMSMLTGTPDPSAPSPYGMPSGQPSWLPDPRAADRSSGPPQALPSVPSSPPSPYGAPPNAAPPGAPNPAYAPPQRARGPSTQFFKLDLEAMALQGLRELAGSLTPGSPLETTGDVARFITKLHDAVDVFCRSFIPLRDGYAQFVSSLDLQQAAHQRNLNRSPAAAILESAATPDAIAMALLNARDQSFDAPAAIEGILADLMLHQVALLDGVMQGVKALLDELSPEQIESTLQQQSKLGLLGGGYKARWEEYRERFERLSDEKQAFSLIFGRQFTQAYRQYWQRQADTTDERLTERPRG